ncbi:unnamed protein product [Cylicocyclus nassatus]|uniref:Uncharacterized protein n=1 Tax=Cylicocyclus nassatus TaxID=53992 RepID=A0AA36H5J8_CYLNA|nr:unnamed protein product [Cylicocyclus nassatus]
MMKGLSDKTKVSFCRGGVSLTTPLFESSMPSEDLYEGYRPEKIHQMQDGANDVYFHNYEPVDDYIAAPIPVSHGDLNRCMEVYERKSSNVKPTFYGETTNRSYFTWKDPVHTTRVPSLSEKKESVVPFYSQTTNREAYSPKVTHNAAVKRSMELASLQGPLAFENSNFLNSTREASVQVCEQPSPSCWSAEKGLNGGTSAKHNALVRIPQQACPVERIIRMKSCKKRYTSGHWWIRTPKAVLEENNNSAYVELHAA